MVTPTREIIKKLLNEIKEEDNKKFSYNIEINFDSVKFYKNNLNADLFWRILTTTFTNYKEYKKTNHAWFKELNPEGFFFYTESYNLVQFRIFLETDNKINIDELRFRIEQLAPIIQLNYSINSKFEFNRMFANDIFTIQKSKIKYIGEVINQNLDDEDEPIDLPF